jgi:hypothetical protein
MSVIVKQAARYFPNGRSFCNLLNFHAYFCPLNNYNKVYQLSTKDFDKAQVRGVNIEDANDTITLGFGTPVTHLKKF